MEVFTTSMEAPTTSMESSINLHEKYFFYEENNLRFAKLAKVVWRQGGGVLSQTVKCNREGKTPGKFIFTNMETKDRTIYKIKKKCVQKYMLAVACRSRRVYVWYYLNLGGRTWGDIVMTQIPGKY